MEAPRDPLMMSLTVGCHLVTTDGKTLGRAGRSGSVPDGTENSWKCYLGMM